MEKTDLTSAEYWESEEIDIRLNPRREIDAEGLHDFLFQDCGIKSSVVLATSGSSGGFKFVVHSKEALLASARGVVAHSGLLEQDRILAGLSGFHVGGIGIYARAFVSGSEVVEMENPKWSRDGSSLLDSLEQTKASVTSMTPTHLYDLVTHEVEAPESLRIVFLGGGKMDKNLIAAARELGWPIRVSYGMTETGSQIATGFEEEFDWLPLLPIWETRMEDDGRLAIRGEALFSGYAKKENGSWSFDSGKTEDGWFVTGDRCELDGSRLRFLGRADDLVKVSGELVSLSELNNLASAIAYEQGVDAAVVAVPDERRENDLVVVIERSEDGVGNFFAQLNAELDGIERVSRIVYVDQLPRTEIGKLDQSELRRLAGGS